MTALTRSSVGRSATSASDLAAPTSTSDSPSVRTSSSASPARTARSPTASSRTVEPENAKSGRARTIPLSEWLLETLLPLSPKLGDPRASVHPFGMPGGQRYQEWDVRREFQRALAACPSIPEEKKKTVVLHTLRHTAASLMVAGGVPIFDVAKVLGHSTLQVTMRYAHFAPEAGRAAIDALDRQLRPPAATPPDRVAEDVLPYEPAAEPLDAPPRLRILPGGSPRLVIRPRGSLAMGQSMGHTPLPGEPD